MAAANPFDPKTGIVASAMPSVGQAATPVSAGGLVNNAATTPAAQVAQTATVEPGAALASAAKANTTEAQGTQIGMDPSKQTVQGQLAGITSKSNPLFTQAVTRAMQQMAQRGLVNSSMGVGAAEGAILDRALPIATSDAGIYQQTALGNADIKNQFELANAGAKNTASQFNAGQENDVSKTNATLKNQAAQFNASEVNKIAQANQKAQTDMQLQALDAATRTNLGNIEANYKTLMQASQSASDLWRQTVDAMTQISMNKDLDGDAKQAAMVQQTQLLQSGMKILGQMNNLNLKDLLNFGGVVTTPGNTVGQGAPVTGGSKVTTPRNPLDEALWRTNRQPEYQQPVG
mgnify:CR=1 FL=1